MESQPQNPEFRILKTFTNDSCTCLFISLHAHWITFHPFFHLLTDLIINFFSKNYHSVADDKCLS